MARTPRRQINLPEDLLDLIDTFKEQAQEKSYARTIRYMCRLLETKNCKQAEAINLATLDNSIHELLTKQIHSLYQQAQELERIRDIQANCTAQLKVVPKTPLEQLLAMKLNILDLFALTPDDYKALEFPITYLTRDPLILTSSDTSIFPFLSPLDKPPFKGDLTITSTPIERILARVEVHIFKHRLPTPITTLAIAYNLVTVPDTFNPFTQEDYRLLLHDHNQDTKLIIQLGIETKYGYVPAATDLAKADLEQEAQEHKTLADIIYARLKPSLSNS